MKKTKIDWCDVTWNPVTGCRYTCEYCYARKMARRFCGDIRLNLSDERIRKEHIHQVNEQTGADLGAYVRCELDEPFINPAGKVIPYPAGFNPTFHRFRLSQPIEEKKPSKIFVCSMADLFGEWVPDSWIEEVFAACDAAPQHEYLFLTKNPHRYIELVDKGKLPEDRNMWFGASATSPEQLRTTIDAFGDIYAPIRTFLSIEPLSMDLARSDEWDNFEIRYTFNWIIVGAETGNRRGKITPKREWMEAIVNASEKTRLPLFMKESDELKAVWGENLIQEVPLELGG